MGDDIKNKILDRTEKIKQINILIDELQKELEAVSKEGKNIELELLKNIDQVKIKKISQIIDKIPN
jgi:hypothetical protein